MSANRWDWHTHERGGRKPRPEGRVAARLCAADTRRVAMLKRYKEAAVSAAGAVVADLGTQMGAPVARIYGEPMLELPLDLYIPPEALEIFLETFEGPLDLLLYLIRKHNLDVLDIPMARLTAQYLEYVEILR